MDLRPESPLPCRSKVAEQTENMNDTSDTGVVSPLTTKDRSAASLSDSGYGNSLRSSVSDDRQSVTMSAQEVSAQVRHEIFHVGPKEKADSHNHSPDLIASLESWQGDIGSLTTSDRSHRVEQPAERQRSESDRRTEESSRFWRVALLDCVSDGLVGIGSWADTTRHNRILEEVGRIDTLPILQFPFSLVVDEEHQNVSETIGEGKPVDELERHEQLCLSLEALSLKPQCTRDQRPSPGEVRGTVCCSDTPKDSEADSQSKRGTKRKFQSMSGTVSQSNPGAKRKQQGQGDDEDDGDDTNRSTRTKSQQDKSSKEYDLPCPFHLVNYRFFCARQHNNSKYKTCSNLHENTEQLWNHFKRVHLFRDHVCVNCCETFKDPTELDVHMTEARCVAVPAREDIWALWLVPGFAAPERLRFIRKNCLNLSQIERWCRIWDALFPDLVCPSAKSVPGLRPEKFVPELRRASEPVALRPAPQAGELELDYSLNWASTTDGIDRELFFSRLQTAAEDLRIYREAHPHKSNNTKADDEETATMAGPSVGLPDEAWVPPQDCADADTLRFSQDGDFDDMNDGTTRVDTQADGDLCNDDWLKKYELEPSPNDNGISGDDIQLAGYGNNTVDKFPRQDFKLAGTFEHTLWVDDDINSSHDTV